MSEFLLTGIEANVLYNLGCSSIHKNNSTLSSSILFEGILLDLGISGLQLSEEEVCASRGAFMEPTGIKTEHDANMGALRIVWRSLQKAFAHYCPKGRSGSVLAGPSATGLGN